MASVGETQEGPVKWQGDWKESESQGMLSCERTLIATAYLELMRYAPRDSMFYCWGLEAAFHLDFLVCNPDLKCNLRLR